MKRLCIITDTWHPQVNGVVRVIDELKKRFERDGVAVVIMHPGMFRSIPVPLYPEMRLSLFSYAKIRRELAHGAFDSVHLMTEGPLGWAGRRACRSLGLSFTTWYHTHFAHYIELYSPAGKRFWFWLTYRIMRRFHAPAVKTFVSNETLRNELRARGFSHLVLSPLGVDPDAFPFYASPRRGEYTTPVFLYVGRLAREKSVEDFLRLDLPGTKVAVGDGPLRAKLERAYPEVVFLGYKRGPDLSEALSLGDVLVFPSRTETFGLVVVEALATGMPVAAHDVMGPRDIIEHGVTGHLHDDLGVAATECLDLSREECRTQAIRFSWDRSYEAFRKNLVPARRD